MKRLPTIQEIANEMGVDPEEIVFAQEANRAPASIHETVYENDGDPITLMDQIADEPVTTWFDKLAIKEAIHRLSDREKLIVYLRYYKDQTQSEVAKPAGNFPSSGLAVGKKNYCQNATGTGYPERKPVISGFKHLDGAFLYFTSSAHTNG